MGPGLGVVDESKELPTPIGREISIALASAPPAVSARCGCPELGCCEGTACGLSAGHAWGSKAERLSLTAVYTARIDLQRKNLSVIMTHGYAIESSLTIPTICSSNTD